MYSTVATEPCGPVQPFLCEERRDTAQIENKLQPGFKAAEHLRTGVSTTDMPLPFTVRRD